MSLTDDEFLDSVAAFIAQLEFGGHPDAAAELRVGFASLQGRAANVKEFVESVNRIETTYAGRLASSERATLKAIRSRARAARRVESAKDGKKARRPASQASQRKVGRPRRAGHRPGRQRGGA